MSPIVNNNKEIFASALQLHGAGDLARAEALYRQVLFTDPRHAEALHMLGFLALQTGRHEAARDHIARSIALAPRVAEAHNRLGLALQALDLPAEAAAAFRRAIGLKRKFAPAWLNLANLMALTGRPEEALEACRRARAVATLDAAAHFNLAKLLGSLGELAAAQAHYDETLRLDPGNAAIHTALATLLHRQDKLDGAICHYRAATKLAPRSSIAFMNLALALRDRGDFRAAAHAAINAHVLAPSDFSCKSLFVDCVKSLESEFDDETITTYLTRALTESWDRPQQLVSSALKILRTDPRPEDLFDHEARR
jgi:tetratricopeptide (TPR) repeat protein